MTNTEAKARLIDASIEKAQKAEARGQIKAAAVHWDRVGRLLAND